MDLVPWSCFGTLEKSKDGREPCREEADTWVGDQVVVSSRRGHEVVKKERQVWSRAKSEE